MRPTEIQHGESEGAQPQFSASAELVLTLRGMSRAMQSFLILSARASRLGLLEYLLLARAADGDGITAREAGRELSLSTSTMTGLTDRLEQDGLIRRHPHPTDRRVLVLKATPRGRKIIEHTISPLLADVTGLASTLPANHRATLEAFMEQVEEVVRRHTPADEATSPDERAIPRGSSPRRPRQSSITKK